MAALLACAPAWAGEPLGKGAAAPARLGEDAAGRQLHLSALRGQVVVVAFWTSWCGYCLKELQALDGLQKSLDSKRLRVVAVNVGDDDADYSGIASQMRRFQYVLTLTRDREGALASAYGVKRYPNLWVVDSGGRVWSQHVGFNDASRGILLADLQALLGSGGDAPIGAAASAR